VGVEGAAIARVFSCECRHPHRLRVAHLLEDRVEIRNFYWTKRELRHADGWQLSLAAVAAALAQEALELAGEALAGGDVLGLAAALVLGQLLEALDKGLHVRIALDR